jgi:hypothetical protein
MTAKIDESNRLGVGIEEPDYAETDIQLFRTATSNLRNVILPSSLSRTDSIGLEELELSDEQVDAFRFVVKSIRIIRSSLSEIAL